MAEYITKSVDPEKLTGYVRERAVLRGQTLLGSVLPPLEVDDIEYELQNINPGVIQVARYRSWDTAPPVGKRPGFATVVGEIAPMGLSLTLNEKELKRFNKLRQGQPEGTDLDIYDDALQTALGCLARYELAAADLLIDGVVTINENGFSTTATFSVPGGHFVTAATAWTDTTNAVPITNLKAYEATYRAANGGLNPDAWLMSDAVIADLASNAQVKSIAAGNATIGTPGIVPEGVLGEVLRIGGVKAPIVPFNGQAPDLTTYGTVGPTLPVRKIFAVRKGMGNVLFTSTPSAELLVGRNLLSRQDAPGIVSFAVEDIVPARVTTTSEAVGLPVLRDPNALFVATV